MGDGIDDEDWALTEQVDVTQIDEGTYRVERVHGAGQPFTMSVGQGPGGSHLFIDGEYKELGDDFIAYVSIIDEYHEQGGEMGKTIRQQPYQDEEVEDV
jgi:hypothetical protein